MKKQIKKFTVTLIMVLSIYCFCSPVSYALVWQNWRECASASNCTTGFQTSIPSIKTYVVESAGYFLDSHSAFQTFLNRFEISEIQGCDYIELRESIYTAIENLEKSKAAYSNLKMISEKIPFNQDLIERLRRFDYDSFMIKNGFIENIFAKLKNFLSNGNMAGYDEAVLTNMDNILSKLYEIKSSIDKDQMPEIALLWRTNQAYMEGQLFSQYMSEVFYDILF